MSDAQYTDALDRAQAFGCPLCGASVTDGSRGEGDAEIGPVVWPLKSAHMVQLTNGEFVDRYVIVCGECWPRLATSEGIAELTAKVNE